MTKRSISILAAISIFTAIPFSVMANPAEEDIYGPIPDGYSFVIGDVQHYSFPDEAVGHGGGNQKFTDIVKGGGDQEQVKDEEDSGDFSISEKAQGSKPEVDLDAYAEQVIQMVNNERAKAGLKELSTDPVLTQMAAVRAAEITREYSHIRPNGQKCFTVFNEFPTTLTATGENIAMSQHTPEEVMEAWMTSKGHKANILRDTPEYIGVGISRRDNGMICWVQLFAQ